MTTRQWEGWREPARECLSLTEMGLLDGWAVARAVAVACVIVAFTGVVVFFIGVVV